jgi:hypothetical protein
MPPRWWENERWTSGLVKGVRLQPTMLQCHWGGLAAGFGSAVHCALPAAIDALRLLYFVSEYLVWCGT